MSVYTPLKILDVKWGLIAEIDVSEVAITEKVLRSNLLTTSLIICQIISVVAILVGVFWR